MTGLMVIHWGQDEQHITVEGGDVASGALEVQPTSSTITRRFGKGATIKLSGRGGTTKISGSS